jgi:hypothetical protein
MQRNDHESERERKRGYGLGWVHLGIQQLAANLLRVIAGAGRPQDIVRHVRALAEFIESYEQAVGRIPGPRECLSCLRISYAEQSIGGLNDVERKRAEAVETILAGSLQIAASRLLGQATQETVAGHKLYKGIRDMERIREQARKERG